MKDPKAIRKAIMTARNIAAMVDPNFARVPLPQVGEPNPEEMRQPLQFSMGGRLPAQRSENPFEQFQSHDPFSFNLPDHSYAAGGGVDDHVVNNPMSVFPKPQRMWDEEMPGGAYLSMPDKADVTGHRAAQASIGIGEGGKPYFNASRDEIDETGTPGRGSALVKTNLFKQKAGWRWMDAPEGHENTGTIVSVEHRGKHHYVMDAHFPNGVDLSRYPDAPSEPRLRPTTRGNVELGPQVGSILVRGREHPVHSHAIVREYGGRVGYDTGGTADDEQEITGYHGSANEFPEFSMEARGRGQGQAAFGEGHNFAEDEDVAGRYRRLTAREHGDGDIVNKYTGEVLPNDAPEAELFRDAVRYGDRDLSHRARNVPHTIAAYKKSIQEYDDYRGKGNDDSWIDKTIEEMHGKIDALQRFAEIAGTHKFVPKGHMYEVGLRVSPSKLLKWHEPVEAQPEAVQRHLIENGVDYTPEWTGKDIYHHLMEHPDNVPESSSKNKYSGKAANQILSDIGIHGIQWKDTDSQIAPGSGKSNYTIWDDSRIKTRRRYAMGGMPDDEQTSPMASSFEAENTPSVTVSPRPGKMGGYPVRAGTMEEHEPWTYTTPQGEDQPTPPPVQHPVFNEPRMDRVHKSTQKIFKSKGFNDLTEELTGLRNFTIKPILGTWKGEIEPSFHISHPDMTPDAAEKLSHLLGFGFMQDAAVKGLHNPNPENEGIPSVYMGRDKNLSKADLDRIHEASREEGLDFSQTSDGRGVKFMHFGDEGDEFDKFAESVKKVQEKAGLPHIHHVNTSGDLNYAQSYLRGIFGPHESEARESGDFSSPSRPSDLFGRVVDHVVAPYAKAVASEGYRLSPDRLRDTYGLSDEEHEKVRTALLPGSKDRTVVPLMEGTEDLDIRPTGDRGKATVGDALFALQNRAAAHGQIEPGDFSKDAMEKIAKDIAKEVDYHVKTADKSAIGWYDEALKKAMKAYEGVFPELKTDDDKRMLFHAILGITSQGNDVHSNSVHTARLYNLLRDGNMSMPEGVEKMKGTFGDKTRAIEQNLIKFHHLVDTNGSDAMRDLFGQKKSVSEWNKILKDNPELHGPDGKPLSMQGGASQKVTGWTVFGPKIGSFINNLSGDYSTLTADLWFSRTWNRLLGHNFIHTPMAEAKQYQDFRDALVAEHAHHNPDQALDEAAPGKTSNGQVAMKNGAPAPWEHGNDVAGMGRDDVDALINDPEKMLEMAKTLSDRYRKGGYKDKSDLRRRAKNWMENRELPVAAPRGNSERDFQQNTVERAQRILKNKYGKDITVADIQAALWFLEKDLFGKMGVASEKAAPADYADAAHNTINLINNDTLYNVKSRPGQATPVAKAYGGGIKKAMAAAAMPQRNQVRSALMIAKGLKKG